MALRARGSSALANGQNALANGRVDVRCFCGSRCASVYGHQKASHTADRSPFQNLHSYLGADMNVNFEKGTGLLYGLLSDSRTRLRQKHPGLKAPGRLARVITLEGQL